MGDPIISIDITPKRQCKEKNNNNNKEPKETPIQKTQKDKGRMILSWKGNQLLDLPL